MDLAETGYGNGEAAIKMNDGMRSRSPRSPREERYERSRSPLRDRVERGPTEASNILGVFGLGQGTREEDLRNIFSEYGQISQVNIILDKRTGASRGFGFVYFETVEQAKTALEKTNGMNVNGRQIRVDFSATSRPHSPTPGRYLGPARPRPPSPRRYPPGPPRHREYRRDYYAPPPPTDYRRGPEPYHMSAPRYPPHDYFRPTRRGPPPPPMHYRRRYSRSPPPVHERPPYNPGTYPPVRY